jgi:hypothetical protein
MTTAGAGGDTLSDWTQLTVERMHRCSPLLLRPFFNNNWTLLNELFRCATRAMPRWARRQRIKVGIFCALYTYGRQLN